MKGYRPGPNPNGTKPRELDMSADKHNTRKAASIMHTPLQVQPDTASGLDTQESGPQSPGRMGKTSMKGSGGTTWQPSRR